MQVSSLSSAPGAPFASGPVRRRTSPAVLDRPSVQDRSAERQPADRRNPGRSAISSARNAIRQPDGAERGTFRVPAAVRWIGPVPLAPGR